MINKTKQKKKVADTLEKFLFNEILNNAKYKEFTEKDIPTYITNNLAKEKILRPYQEEAIKRLMFYLDSNNKEYTGRQLLFNMATGTGKTLVMVTAMLHLYTKGYRNFIFLVHRNTIIEQAKKAFTDDRYEKHLFNEKISIEGNIVNVNEVTDFENGNDNDINIIFLTTQMLYSYIKEEGENRITLDDFKDKKICILADEAHQLNVEARNNKTKTDKKEMTNWESVVMRGLNARPDNLLLEFTATVDLENVNIHNKYSDKLIYKYDFLTYNTEGYSKQVQFLYNKETDLEDQKKQLIVHAVALSQYRKLKFEEINEKITPIILVKSKAIKDSDKDKEYFDDVINNLTPRDLIPLKKTIKDEYGLIEGLFAYLKQNNITETQFLNRVRVDFAKDRTIIYNSKNTVMASKLLNLDDKENLIRVVFSVNALNEGWDVLSLYDIIHFEIGDNKKVSLQDIQLIGRGARYCPFELPAGLENNLFDKYENDKFRRKFDKEKLNTNAILETFYYHFSETQTFLDQLQQKLAGEGIINEQVHKVTTKMKKIFEKSDIYKKGFVLVNRTESRNKVDEELEDTTFNKTIECYSYQIIARALTDKERNQQIANERSGLLNIVKDFNINIIKKALIKAENGFFRFDNLSEHVVGIKSIDEFIKKKLSRYKIQYSYEDKKGIEDLNSEEKLNLLIGAILPNIRELIDTNLPKQIGTSIFTPTSIQQVFSKINDIYITSFPVLNEKTGKMEIINTDERAVAQTGHSNKDLELDISTLNWYAYNENYGTSEEKKFVRFINTQIEKIKIKYKGAEIFLVRNELEYWLFSKKDGRRFSPDYLMFINDKKTNNYYYQCIFEAKGSHLIEKDKWKEKALQDLEKDFTISFDVPESYKEKVKNKTKIKNYKRYLDGLKKRGYKEIKNIGFSFYNRENEIKSLEELSDKLNLESGE